MKQLFVFLFTILLLFSVSCSAKNKITDIEVNYKPPDANYGVFTAKCGDRLCYIEKGTQYDRICAVSEGNDVVLADRIGEAYQITGNQNWICYLRNTGSADLFQLNCMDPATGAKVAGFTIDRTIFPIVVYKNTLVRSDMNWFYEISGNTITKIETDVPDQPFVNDKNEPVLVKGEPIGDVDSYWYADSNSSDGGFVLLDQNENFLVFPDGYPIRLFCYGGRICSYTDQLYPNGNVDGTAVSLKTDGTIEKFFQYNGSLYALSVSYHSILGTQSNAHNYELLMRVDVETGEQTIIKRFEENEYFLTEFGSTIYSCDLNGALYAFSLETGEEKEYGKIPLSEKSDYYFEPCGEYLFAYHSRPNLKKMEFVEKIEMVADEEKSR